jgi:hypothetical protein
MGVFYGAWCRRPFLVPIPVRDGVERPPTLDDLYVNYWVKQHGLDECTATRRNLRRTFCRVPGSDFTLDGKYTMYFDRPQQSTPQNDLLTRLCSMSGSRETLRGSVVVVKQAPDYPHHIVDMTKRDQLISNFLIARYASFICNSGMSVTK